MDNNFMYATLKCILKMKNNFSSNNSIYNFKMFFLNKNLR